MAGESTMPRDCRSVIARFEEDAALVAELAQTCDQFRALCEEHALATDVVERRRRMDSVSDPAFFEYLQIVRDLEHEIATRLANEKRSLRRGESGRSKGTAAV